MLAFSLLFSIVCALTSEIYPLLPIVGAPTIPTPTTSN